MRILTRSEIESLKTNNRYKLWLLIDEPNIVWVGTLNSSVSAHPTVEIPVTRISSSPLPDMIYNHQYGLSLSVDVLIGDQPGSSKYGNYRFRSINQNETLIKIGETDQLDAPSGAYVTIVFDAKPRIRGVRIVGEKIMMDYDISKVQNDVYRAIMTMGTDRVLWWNGNSVDVSFVGTHWVQDLGGSAPGTNTGYYVYTAPGNQPAQFITNSNQPNVTIRFFSPGRYVVVRGSWPSGGYGTRTMRVVNIIGENTPNLYPIKTSEIRFKSDSGDWEAEVTVPNTNIVNVAGRRAYIIVSPDDLTYQDDVGNAILFSGFVSEESEKEFSEDGEKLKLRIVGYSKYLSSTANYPLGLSVRRPGYSKTWVTFDKLNLRNALWHTALWRTTLSEVVDIPQPPNTVEVSALETSAGSLWEQIKELGEPFFIDIGFSRAGTLRAFYKPELLPNPLSVQEGLEITDDDVINDLILGKKEPEIARLEVSGVAYSGGTSGKGTPYFARAYGNSLASRGWRIESVERLALSDESDCITKAKRLMAQMNSEYDTLVIDVPYLASSLDFDQYIVRINSSGIGQLNCVPREISFLFSGGAIKTRLSLEIIMPDAIAVKYVPPQPQIQSLAVPTSLFSFPLVPGAIYIPVGDNPALEIPESYDPSCIVTPSAPQNGPYRLPISGAIKNGKKERLLTNVWTMFRPYYFSYRSSYIMGADLFAYNTSTGEWKKTDDLSFFDVVAYAPNGQRFVATKNLDSSGRLIYGEWIIPNGISIVAIGIETSGGWTGLEVQNITVNVNDQNIVTFLTQPSARVIDDMMFVYSGIIEVNKPAGYGYFNTARVIISEYFYTNKNVPEIGNVSGWYGFSILEMEGKFEWFYSKLVSSDYYAQTDYIEINQITRFGEKEIMGMYGGSTWVPRTFTDMNMIDNTRVVFCVNGFFFPAPKRMIAVSWFDLYNVCPPAHRDDKGKWHDIFKRPVVRYP